VERKRKKKFLFEILWLSFLLLGSETALPSSMGGKDPMDRREEQLRIFQEKRDHFFKEDPRSPLTEADRKKFKGLNYFPIDLRYAMIGSIARYPTDPKPLYVSLPTNKSPEKRYVKYGRFRFNWAGREYVLQIYRSLGGDELFLPFRDKTSGTETYPEGRYLFIESLAGEKVLIDFNRAYNPFCEYNGKYTCPYAPKENWLDIAVQAGEKRFRRHP
jgi:uncharacterized protein (DUF1684 family)